MTRPEIEIFTLEELATGSLGHKFAPPKCNASWKRFPIEKYDPIRNAVVPVFISDKNEKLSGIGTAFFADSWGNMVSATHLFDNKEIENAFILQNVQLAYGRVPVPEDLFLPIVEAKHLKLLENDPMGGSPKERPTDVSSLKLGKPPAPAKHSLLPINLKNSNPKTGDYVFAVGFPKILERQNLSIEEVAVIDEDICGAFGKISALVPHGRGSIFPTPAIEVESEWPPGMSGGPVFNMKGQIIGVVSTSFGQDPPVATASCFQYMCWLPGMFPTLDPCDPEWRRGWAVFDAQDQIAGDFFGDEGSARKKAQSLNQKFTVKYVSRRIGTDEYKVES